MARWRNTEFDEIVTEMSKIPATDPQTMDLFEDAMEKDAMEDAMEKDAMEIWYEELPDIYVSQLIIRHLGSENYWDGWPSFDDNYGVLRPWQQEFLKIVTRLEAN